MHKIKEKLMNALYDYEDKAKKSPDGKISAGELQEIHMLTDTIKNIDKIEMLEDGGYSEDGHYMGEGRIYGTSYARDGRSGEHYVKGHYGRNGMMHHDEETSYDRKRDRMGRYSRGGAKDYMLEQLEEMMKNVHSDKERKAIEHCIKQIEEA